MRVVGFTRDGTHRLGVIEGAPGREMVRDAGPELLDLRDGEIVGPLADIALSAPVPHPSKIVCVGRNYAEHATETGGSVPSEPQLFAKWANAIVGPGEPVRHPMITHALDYEAELVVVIGRRARAVAEDRALEHVLGYMCGNDISARDLQFGDVQWTRGKALDTFAPTGPWIVTEDEIPDPQGLRIRCRVDGEVMQDASTADMIFGVAEIIAFASEAITLEPGDLIFTGTPSGVGVARTPPVFLHPGSRVAVDIERIGVLENPIVGPASEDVVARVASRETESAGTRPAGTEARG